MKIKDLNSAGYNPRKISDEQLQRLKKSLVEFGDLSGIVFNRQTGNNKIIKNGKKITWQT